MAEVTVHWDGPLVARAEARARGENRYFTGKPCRNGHVSQRFVSNYACCKCETAYRATYLEANKETIAAREKAYRETNKERRAAHWAAYYESNKHRLSVRAATYHKSNRARRAAYAKTYREANRDRLAALWAAYHEANRDRLIAYRENNKERIAACNAAYRKANPEARRAQDRNRKARKRTAEGSHTAAEILALLERQRCKCVYCGASLKKGYDADHITPLSKGGSNSISNIQLTCPTCNRSKGAKDPIKFARQMGKLL